MTDNRIALHNGSKICNGGKSILVKEEIGRGANCIVYDAVCTDGIGVEHSVRIKECYPSYLLLGRTEEGTITACEKEAEKYQKAKETFVQGYRKNVALKGTLGIVNSTVDVSDIFEKNNTIYIVMTMDEGVDYRRYRDSSLKELLKHMKSLSELILKYHERGYLHLDIKPENVFVLPETAEHILLFDYDSVTTLEELQTAGRFKLSFSEGFSAPEQIQGKINKIGKHTDIYSIGAMLFFKLFNRKPVLEDSKVSAEYDFEHMLYSDEKYQPKLYRRLKDFFKKTLSVAAVIRWQEMQSVIDMLDELISLSDLEEISLLDSFQYNSAYFFGRNEEMENIRDILTGHQSVFLSGIGGIGKTELARQYANKYRNQYDTIVFCVFEKNIQSLVCDEIEINHINREESEPEDAYFKRKIEVLKQVVTSNDLIIIDNFDVESDDKLELLFSCPCKFIITTRTDFRDYNYNQITVDKIDNLNDILSLFYAYNDTFYSEDENEAVKKLVDYVDYHTMTVELIAKYLRNSEESPVGLYERFLEKEGTANTDEIGIKQRKDRKLRSESVNSHLSILFNVSGFEEIEKEIISSLSLFAGIRIKKSKFSTLCAMADIESKLEHLIRNGWIEYNEFTEKISLHQVIQDLIYKNLRPVAETCPNILKGMSEYFSADTANASEREIRSKVFDVFMDRLSGNNIPYVRLCLKYGKNNKLDQAEKICLDHGDSEAFDLLQRIYREKIRIAGECNDIFESELDMEEYLIQRFAVMEEMFDKVLLYCKKSSENPDYIVKEYIEAGCDMDSVLGSNAVFYSEEPVPAMDKIYRKIISIFDSATEFIPLTSYSADEKIQLYQKIQEFYANEYSVLSLYRSKYFLDIEKGYKYQQLMDQLREDMSGDLTAIDGEIDRGTIPLWQPNMALAEEYEKKGKYEEAIEYYKKACDEGEEIYAVAMNIIADIYLRNGRPDMAAASLEKVLEDDKKDEKNPKAFFHYSGDVCFNLIKVFLQLKDYEKAKIYAKEMIHYKKADTIKEDNADSVTYVLAAYFFLYILEDKPNEKERLWKECVKYYEMLKEGEIKEYLYDFIVEYLERETKSYDMILKILKRISEWKGISIRKKIIQRSIEKYHGEESFHRYHIIFLLKLAECSNESPYEHIKEGIENCNEAIEYYAKYGIEDEYILSMINNTKTKIMSQDEDYKFEEIQEIRKRCNYRLLAEHKIINNNCGEEEQIDIWKDAADQYGDIDNYEMEIVCLNKALEVGIPMERHKTGIVLSNITYTDIMANLIRAYIKLKAFESANAAINKLYVKTIDYMKTDECSYGTWERVWKIRQIAEFFVEISRNADAVRMYLTAMYVVIKKELKEDILTEGGATETRIIHLCEAINELLEALDPDIVDLVIDLKDALIICRDNGFEGYEAYDAIITKITDRYQHQEIEFKRQ